MVLKFYLNPLTTLNQSRNKNPGTGCRMGRRAMAAVRRTEVGAGLARDCKVGLGFRDKG